MSLDIDADDDNDNGNDADNDNDNDDDNDDDDDTDADNDTSQFFFKCLLTNWPPSVDTSGQTNEGSWLYFPVKMSSFKKFIN